MAARDEHVALSQGGGGCRPSHAHKCTHMHTHAHADARACLHVHAHIPPSLLKVEDADEAGGGDLPAKRRVVEDMLRLIDAIPESSTPPEGGLTALMLENTRGPPVQASLQASLQAAASAGAPIAASRGASAGVAAGAGDRERRALDAEGGGGGCVRKWRLGGCVHCPRWEEVSAIWRSSAERRRSGGFVALCPSGDPEWTSLAANGSTAPPITLLRQSEEAANGAANEAANGAANEAANRAANEAANGAANEAANGAAWGARRRTAETPAEARRRPSLDELLAAWSVQRAGEPECAGQGVLKLASGSMMHCIKARWEAMLCPP